MSDSANEWPPPVGAARVDSNGRPTVVEITRQFIERTPDAVLAGAIRKRVADGYVSFKVVERIGER